MSKRIIITGTSRGLGKAMAEGFAAAGHEVLGCARQPSGNPERFFTCDIADASQVQSFAEAVLAQGGPPDILINNAAMINDNAPLWEVGEEEFSRLIDINIKGTANMIRHFVPAMVEAGQGVIVNFSSYWGRSTSPDVAPYCASKWAIEGLTAGLADDLPRGLAAIALNPGVIDTDMLRTCFGAGAGASISPTDWAEAAVPFIESFNASMNGQSLTVPGQ